MAVLYMMDRSESLFDFVFYVVMCCVVVLCSNLYGYRQFVLFIVIYYNRSKDLK